MDSYTRDTLLEMWRDHKTLTAEYIESIQAHNNYVRDQRYFHSEFEEQGAKLEALSEMYKHSLMESDSMEATYQEKIAELLTKLSQKEEDCLELSYRCQELEGELAVFRDRFATTAESLEAPEDKIETGVGWYEEHGEEEGSKTVPDFDNIPQIRIPLDDELLKSAANVRQELERALKQFRF